MNPSNPEYSYGGAPRSSNRPNFDPRGHVPNSNPPIRQGPPSQASIESNQSRAARYEDEKRRIIESCFSKKEPDGTLLESYITHVRVTEDAQYPSQPPPPDSAPGNKKNRLILVAVRKSGRVRVHKARENPTGSFSIGKTWALDELSLIQIFAGGNPTNEKERMEKTWAGDVGFTVTLGKPYYWHAPTAKERDFFIASLLKIYKKYTGGKVPGLTGFLPHQMEQLGAVGSRTPSGSVSQTTPPQFSSSPPPVPATVSQRPQSPQMQRFSPGLSNKFDQPPHRADLRPAQRDGTSSPMPEPLRSPARMDRRMPSRENMRRSPGPDSASPSGLGPRDTPAAPPVPRQVSTPKPLNPQSSHLPLESREQQGFPPTARPVNGASQYPKPPTDPQDTSTEVLPTNPAVRDRSFSSAHSSDRLTTSTSEATSLASRQMPDPNSLAPPDRKRPFLPRAETNGAKSNASNSQFAIPATSPGASNDEPVVPILSREEMPKGQQVESPPKKDYFASAPPPQSPEHKWSEPSALVSKEATVGASTIPDEKTAEPEEMSSPAKAEEDDRPGLGPMVKKKIVADQFRKAAFAASAFKPRQGGGAARLKALQGGEKKGNEPDGITGVVPAPLLRGMSADSVASDRPATPLTPGSKDQPAIPQPGAQAPRVNLERTATEDTMITTQPQHAEQSTKSKQLLSSPVINETAPPSTPPQETPQEPPRPQTPEKTRSRSPQRRKRQRQEADIAKYSSSLGIDPRILEGRGADFTDLLAEFGWEGKLDAKRRVDDLETDVRREIGRAQATGWLGHVEQQENKVQELAKAFDRAIEECEELDGLFILYSHELDTLAADIEYIEAQSQGLQVQTSNQKLLQKELRSLLSMLSISDLELKDLHRASLDDPRGVTNIEQALSTLYRALILIDPNIPQNRQRREGQGTVAAMNGESDISKMRAVREKKDEYGQQSQAFIQRYCQHMNAHFKRLEQNRDEVSSINSDSSSSLSTQRTARQELWLYNGMMLFVREVDSYEWKTLIKSYEMNIRGSYQEQFRQTTMISRRDARKPTGEEQEALFTYQEKDKPEDSSLTSSAARKLTVKRGKTVKSSGLKPSFGKPHDGKPDAWEVFQNVLEQQSKVIAEEQNFMVCFFHLSSQSNLEFTELVSMKAPEERRLPNLNAKIPFEPDKDISLTIQASIESIYSFWLGDLSGQLEWVLSIDQLQGVGVMFALEYISFQYEDSNQEFITTTINKVHDRLQGLFSRFVDEQIKAIEETKVKLKKRKGIISFMRTFPVFSTTVEHMIPTEVVDRNNLRIRFILNDAYTKILKAMWESLTFIAKDDTAGGTSHSTAPSSGDPEDKEALNYHILLIENMNHYVEEVETQGNIVLEEWKDKATHDMLTHLKQYTDAIIRRPLGKWLDFVESTEAMMKTTDSYQAIAGKPSHSRSTCKKVIKSYDASSVRKDIETLKRRVEKHFGDVDDPTTMSKSLIARVYDECNGRYATAYDRMRFIIDKIYEKNVEIDWRKEEVDALFKR